MCLGRQFIIWVSNKDKRIDELKSHGRKENTAKIFFAWMYVYFKTEFVFSDTPGTSGPWSWMRGSCWDLLAKRTNKYEKTAAEFQEFADFKEVFKHCKVPKGLHTWEIIISNNKRKIYSLLLRKTAILTIVCIDEKKSAWWAIEFII